MLPTSISSFPVTFLKQEGVRKTHVFQLNQGLVILLMLQTISDVKTNPMYMVGYTWCRLHFLVGNQYLRFYKVPSSQTPRLHNSNTQWNSSKVLILNLPLTLWDYCHHKQITTTLFFLQPSILFAMKFMTTKSPPRLKTNTSNVFFFCVYD